MLAPKKGSALKKGNFLPIPLREDTFSEGPLSAVMHTGSHESYLPCQKKKKKKKKYNNKKKKTTTKYLSSVSPFGVLFLDNIQHTRHNRMMMT